MERRLSGPGIGLLLLLLVGLVNFAAGSAEDVLHPDVHHEGHGKDASHLKELELERVAHQKEIEDWKHKLSSLELRLQDHVILLKHKDQKIVSLQADLDQQQKKDTKDVEAKLEAALSRVQLLEAEIVDLKAYSKELEQTVEALNSRAQDAEASADELLSKLEKAEKASAEQKKKLSLAERALKIAEAAMRKAEAEVASKAQELLKVYEGWLPPWAVTHLAQLQASAASKWLEHGEPHYKAFRSKVTENTAAFEKWAKPHVTNLQKNWSPYVKQQFDRISKLSSPYTKNARKKAKRGYETTKNTFAPHFENAQKYFEPYWQVVQERAKPYVETWGSAVGPHYQKARTLAEPHVERLSVVYRDLLSSATAYHQQVQASVKSTLSKHESFSSLASREVVWFLASLLVALPVVAAFVVLSSAFSTVFRGKKPSKPVRHSHKKAKRVKQVDK